MSVSQKMYWVCSDVLSLILQIRNSKDLPPSEVLQRRVLSLFESMMQNGRKEQIPEQDMVDAKYALAAFLDEVIYNSSWTGKNQWLTNPLQLQFFQLNTAGDGFFANLDNLYGQRGRVHVAQIYYLCLSLGFQGRYRLKQQDSLVPIIEGLGNYVALNESVGEVLAPHAERKDGRQSEVRRELPFLAISLGFLLVAILVLIVLRLVLGAYADSAAESIRKLLGK